MAPVIKKKKKEKLVANVAYLHTLMLHNAEYIILDN